MYPGTTGDGAPSSLASIAFTSEGFFKAHSMASDGNVNLTPITPWKCEPDPNYAPCPERTLLCSGAVKTSTMSTSISNRSGWPGSCLRAIMPSCRTSVRAAPRDAGAQMTDMKTLVKVIGKSGQISFGKEYAGRRVLVEELAPGEWRVRPE